MQAARKRILRNALLSTLIMPGIKGSHPLTCQYVIVMFNCTFAYSISLCTMLFFTKATRLADAVPRDATSECCPTGMNVMGYGSLGIVNDKPGHRLTKPPFVQVQWRPLLKRLLHLYIIMIIIIIVLIVIYMLRWDVGKLLIMMVPWKAAMIVW